MAAKKTTKKKATTVKKKTTASKTAKKTTKKVAKKTTKKATKKVAKKTTKKTATKATKKVAAKPTAKAAAPSVVNKTKKKTFPKTFLVGWVKNKISWGHYDWENLLAILGEEGFSELAYTYEGQRMIGEFIEQARLVFLKKKQFPTKILKEWLKDRTYWSHVDWEQLLGILAGSGYADFAHNVTGQSLIGEYLEKNRVR